MATFNKFNSFVEYLAEGINLGSDTLKVALTNTAPSASNSKLSDITEIDYTYCSDRTLSVTSSAQSNGTYKLIVADKTISASGGSVGPFRYVVIYDDTHADKPLICWYDYGSSITLNDGESLTIDFDQTNGLLQLT
jgi:hypothetical protein